MKTKAVALAICATWASVAWGNVLPTFRIVGQGADQKGAVVVNSAIRGETVYARIEKTGTQVEARYDIGDNDRKIDSIYFPVFATAGVSEASLLDQCNFNAALGGTPLEDIVVVRAPVPSPKLPAGIRIVWFQFMRKDQKDITADGDSALIFKISYWQPHVTRHFYYLPQSIAHTGLGDGVRDWRFPLIIRSLSRTTPDPDSKVDFDRVAELLIVYMRNSEIVSIPAP